MSIKTEFLHLLPLLTVYYNEISSGFGDNWLSVFYINHEEFNFGEDRIKFQTLSWINMLRTIGYPIGLISSVPLLNVVGRRFLLSSSAILNTISWCIILYVKSFYFLYTASLIIGISLGINTITNSIYIGEIASSATRSTSAFILPVFRRVGFFLGIFIINNQSYLTAVFIIFLIELVLVSPIFFLVETPHFLIMKGKLEKAEKNFAQLKEVHDSEAASAEFSMIKNNVYDEVSKQKLCCKCYTFRENYRSLLIVFIFTILSQSTGYNIVAFYSPRIAHMRYSTDFFILTESLSLIFISFIIRFINRKTILLISSSLICFTQLLLAIVTYKELNEDNSSYLNTCLTIAIGLYFAACTILFSELFLARTELFPLSIKAFGNCLILLCIEYLPFTTLFNNIEQLFGLFCTFLIFSVNGFIFTLFIYFILPKTENKSLLEIQDLLKNN